MALAVAGALAVMLGAGLRQGARGLTAVAARRQSGDNLAELQMLVAGALPARDQAGHVALAGDATSLRFVALDPAGLRRTHGLRLHAGQLLLESCADIDKTCTPRLLAQPAQGLRLAYEAGDGLWRPQWRDETRLPARIRLELADRPTLFLTPRIGP